MDLKELEKIEQEKKIVLKDEKPLLECDSPEDLSDRQWELYSWFRESIRNQTNK